MTVFASSVVSAILGFVLLVLTAAIATPAVSAIVGFLLLCLAVERANAMTRATRLRWLKAPLWAALGMLGLGLVLRPAAAGEPETIMQAKAQSGLTVSLHREVGPCVDGAKLATIHHTDGTSVPGCWKSVQERGVVTIGWLDGYSNTFAIKVFKKPDEL